MKVKPAKNQPLINEHGQVGQGRGDGRATDTQPGYQHEGGNEGDRQPNKRGIEVVLRLTRTGEIIVQDGVGGEEDHARCHQQDNRTDVAELRG